MKGILIVIFYILIMTAVTTWLLIEARPAILWLGFSEYATDQFPLLGLVFGTGLGLLIWLSPAVKQFFAVLLAFAAFIALMGFVVIALQSILINGFDVPENNVYRLTKIVVGGGSVLVAGAILWMYCTSPPIADKATRLVKRVHARNDSAPRPNRSR